MVTASMWEKHLKEQDIKEKRRLEKEAAEKRRKDAIEKYAQKRKLERELAERLDAKLDRLEGKTHYRPYIKTRDEFIFTEEDKVRCREKTLDELVDDIGGSQLVCPPGKELKKEVDKKELTADLKCFRKRVRRKSPEEIVALYDRLLAADPERLCKEKKE